MSKIIINLHFQVVLNNTSESEISSILSKTEYVDNDVSPIHYAVENGTHNELIMTLKVQL